MQNHRLCESPIGTSRAERSCTSQLYNTLSQKTWGTYQIKSYCAAPGHILLCTEQHSPTATSPHGKSPHSLHLPSHFCNDETQCHIILHDFRLWLKKKWSQRLLLILSGKKLVVVAGLWFTLLLILGTQKASEEGDYIPIWKTMF